MIEEIESAARPNTERWMALVEQLDAAARPLKIKPLIEIIPPGIDTEEEYMAFHWINREESDRATREFIDCGTFLIAPAPEVQTIILERMHFAIGRARANAAGREGADSPIAFPFATDAEALAWILVDAWWASGLYENGRNYLFAAVDRAWSEARGVENAVVLLTPAEPPEACEAMQQKMAGLTLAAFFCEDTGLRSAVDKVVARLNEEHPESGIGFEIDEAAEVESLSFQADLDLRAVPLWELVKIIASAFGLACVATARGARITRASGEELMHTRRFNVPAWFFPDVSGAGARQHLESLGIGFPEGSGLAYAPLRFELYLRNVPRAMAQVESLIGDWAKEQAEQPQG